VISSCTVIGNPAAGRGGVRRFAETIEREFRSRGIEYEMLFTGSRGEATTLAKHAAFPIIAALGGDGTVHEVVNGIAGTKKVLAVLPAGSGNDFVKSIGVSSRFDSALEMLIDGKTRTIDLGKVTIGSNSHSSFFVNGLGMGFDASVADRVQQMRFFSGTLLYILAVLRTLHRYRAPRFSVQVDENVFNARNLLIAVGNGICAGGGFYLTPEALIDDGLLDVCMIKELPINKILRIIPLVMKGTHCSRPEVTYTKSLRINVSTESPEAFTVHADGEILGRGVTSVSVSIADIPLSVIGGKQGE
jgi:diacylglycerol kinase (ATP)